ncbi:serine hydrolase domain-containing protein [Phenylobacterium sp.]|jgi:CubicO group peptidase (beta-lactamase class C family)|uniref:serine hydrolase domain-containing protein n=1 Tax=Phenylobacterium sp. TaxID=1871053 RepID=UPI002F3E78F7
MFARFEAALAQAIDRGRIAGGVALALDRDGVTYSHAAGARTVGEAAPMDLATVFWIASMTKAVASVAALQLVERGAVSLDGDLSALVPELGRLQVLETAAEGTRSLRPAKRAPTLRELLTHTSGFAYGFSSADFAAHLETTGGNPNDGARASLLQPLLFDPGEGWVYGIGIDWAGVVIEAASGQGLGAYLAEHVFGPLGMTDTGFSTTEAQARRRAGVHVRGPDGLMAIPFNMPKDPEIPSAGGGLYATVPDYGRFLRMLLNGGALDGARILSADTVRELSRPQTGDRRTGWWKTAQPNFSNDFDLHPGLDAGHGLATMVAPADLPRRRRAGALAWGGLANTYYWADPTAGKAGVLMTQLLPFGDPEVLGLLDVLERDVYGVA